VVQFQLAAEVLGGVELMHMIRRGQMRDDGRGLSAAQQFYLLAEYTRDCAAYFHSGASLNATEPPFVRWRRLVSSTFSRLSPEDATSFPNS
jgi:hypothetical protein